MKRRLLFLLLAVLPALVGWRGDAAGFTKTELVIPMSDGVGIAATLYTPTGTPPQGGWPAVMLLHGLGRSRVLAEATKWSVNDVAERYFADAGYEVLTYDARAHGASGGVFTLDGPREVQDLKELFAWFAARPDVSGSQIGGAAISYGGGALWLVATQGVPFAALGITASWTDFERAIFPQGLVKTGVVFGFLNAVPPDRLDPLIVKTRDALLANATGELRGFAAARSSRPLLGQIKIPVFLMQGRRDFAFDIEEAVAAYRRLAGPKRLYIGDLGHAPAGDPEAEIPHYLGEQKLWFDRFLKGARNGIDTAQPVEVAPDPWTGKTVSFPGLPPTETLTFRAGGTATISREGKVVRTLTVTRSRVEEFGAPVVQVAVKPAGGWSHLVAVLSARTSSGTQIVVSEGGSAVRKAGTLTIRLLSLGTPIPKGSRLLLTLAASSTAQDPANLLYLDIPQPDAARVTIGMATVRIPVLRRPISR